MTSGETKKKRSKAPVTLPVGSRRVALKRLFPWLAEAVVLLALCAMPIVALLAWQQGTHARSDGFVLDFLEIKIATPPMLPGPEFLEQVRNASQLPPRLPLLQPGLAASLARAFELHPWVESVRRVEIGAKAIEADLRYRVPVLEIESATGDPRGIVDTHGMMLTRDRFVGKLPVLRSPLPSEPRAGQQWKLSSVLGAAKLAGWVRPHQGELQVVSIETTSIGLVAVTTGGSRILWGEPPGREREGEALAEQKIQRLLEYHESHGSLDKPDGRYEHDVRPGARALHKPLP